MSVVDLPLLPAGLVGSYAQPGWLIDRERLSKQVVLYSLKGLAAELAQHEPRRMRPIVEDVRARLS